MREWYSIDDEVLLELEKDYGILESEYKSEKSEKTKFYSNLLNRHLSEEQQNDIHNGSKCLTYTSEFPFKKFNIQIVIAINITNNITTHFKFSTIISIDDAINLRNNPRFRELVKFTFYIEDKYKNIKNQL